MPIKPENVHRYPPNWHEVRAAVLARAGFRCEWPGCGARHQALGLWRNDVFMQIVHPDEISGFDFDLANSVADDARVIVIVLTVAHLDHKPENCAIDNLRAWCQRHHLRYDIDHHRCTAYMTRRARAATLDLF